MLECSRLRTRPPEPNGFLPPGGAELSLWGTRAALHDGSLACLFSVPAHCPLSRLFAYNVRLCLLFGFISTAEFRDSSSSERERAEESEEKGKSQQDTSKSGRR